VGTWSSLWRVAPPHVAGTSRERTARSRVTWISLAVGVVALAVAWLVARADPGPAPIVSDTRIPSVRVVPVTTLEASHELRLPGTTRAVRRASLSFVVSGRLVERAADVGDRVTRGAVVARLDPGPFHNEVHAAEAALAEVTARLGQTKRAHRRLIRLHQQGVASRRALEEVTASEDGLRASRELAQSRRDEAHRRLAEAALVAPFDGTVTSVHLEPAEYAQVGASVIKLSGDDRLELQVEVPESVASTFTEGDAAQVRFPLAGRPPLPARLKSVSRSAEGPGRLFSIVAELEPAPALLPGMAAELVLRAGRGRRLAVPLASIIDPSGRHPYVFRVEQGRAERVPVEVGTLVEDRVTVTAALESGDSIVVAGHGALLEGDPVDIR
jgi:RND family efflux transporter MFP subunit